MCYWLSAGEPERIVFLLRKLPVAHAMYRDFFICKNENFIEKFFDIFNIFAQNIEAVLTSTHNLCFGSTIRKIGIPLHIQDFTIQSGV